MGKIVTAAIRKTYKTLIRDVVEDLHKPVIAHMPPEKADCPNCHWDSVNNKSSGTFNNSFTVSVNIFDLVINPSPFTRGRCPVCLGQGFLVRVIDRNIKALVKWNPDGPDDLRITPAGREGAPAVRIKVLRADYDIVNKAEYFTVDGVRCEVNTPFTIRGLGTQEELVVGYLISTEVGKDIKG